MNNIYIHKFNKFISANEKNDAIDSAVKTKADYILFTAYDPVADDVIQKYIDKMVQYDLVCIFYGYHNYNNCVFKVPNPAMRVRIDDFRVEVFNRIPTFGFVIINLKKNIPRFNTSLKMLDFNLFLQNCCNSGVGELINGMYFDIENSNLLFNDYELTSEEKALVKYLRAEDVEVLKSCNIQLTYESNADKLFKFIYNKNKGRVL